MNQLSINIPEWLFYHHSPTKLVQTDSTRPHPIQYMLVNLQHKEFQTNQLVLYLSLVLTISAQDEFFFSSLFQKEVVQKYDTCQEIRTSTYSGTIAVLFEFKKTVNSLYTSQYLALNRCCSMLLICLHLYNLRCCPWTTSCIDAFVHSSLSSVYARPDYMSDTTDTKVTHIFGIIEQLVLHLGCLNYLLVWTTVRSVNACDLASLLVSLIAFLLPLKPPGTLRLLSDSNSV